MSLALDLSDQTAVAAELRELVDIYPDELAPCSRELRRLASALDATGPSHGSSDLDSWSELNLIGAFARPDSVRASTVREPWWRHALDLAPSVLVFVPILITWAGISAATSAYGRLLKTGDRSTYEGRSFLDLWQTGFGGHLWSIVTFGHLAAYTVTSIVVLIAAVVAGSYLRRSAEAAVAERDDAVMRDLVSVLRRAQLVLGRWRLAAPGRFAEELSQAAILMRQLMYQAEVTQRGASELAERNVRAAAQLDASARQLATATTGLQGTGEAVRSATGTLETTTSTLRDEVSTRTAAAARQLDTTVTAATKRLDVAVAAATSQLTDAVTGVTSNLDTATATAAEHVGQLQKSGAKALTEVTAQLKSSLRDLGSRVDDALGRAAAALDASSEESSRRLGELHGAGEAALIGANSALDGTLRVLSNRVDKALDEVGDRIDVAAKVLRDVSADCADRMASAATRAADDTARACNDAVAAVVVRLATQLTQTTGELAASAAEISAAVAAFTDSAARIPAGASVVVPRPAGHGHSRAQRVLPRGRRPTRPHHAVPDEGTADD